MLNAGAQDSAQRAVQGGRLGLIQTVCRTQGMQAGAMQGLVRIDIAHAGEEALIEQQRFQRAAAFCEAFAQTSGRELAGQGLRPQRAGHRVHICRQPDATELARV